MPTFQRAAIYLVFLWVLGRGLEALGGVSEVEWSVSGGNILNRKLETLFIGTLAV